MIHDTHAGLMIGISTRLFRLVVNLRLLRLSDRVVSRIFSSRYVVLSIKTQKDSLTFELTYDGFYNVPTLKIYLQYELK